MKVVFHPDFRSVYTPDPAAEAGRMESILEAIEGESEFLEAEPAAEAEIAAVHTPEHMAWVHRRGLYPIAALSAGGAIRAAETGLGEPCFGLIRPPGHHASAGSAWGFCYFNNMAVAIEAMRARGRIRSPFVLDFDLHFGDGTVDIYRNRPEVSVFNPSAFPREAYLEEVREALAGCRADLIGVSAGFDNLRNDWGGLLTTGDYAEMGGWVREAASRIRCGGLALLEGGYNHRVLGRNVRAFLRGFSGSPTDP